MRPKRIAVLKGFLVLAVLLSLTSIATTQSPDVRSGVTEPIDNGSRITLPGNTHRLARPEFDRGAVPDSLPLERMLLVLKRSSEQEAELRTLLGEQQDKASPNFHKWLTPEQFGQKFGPSDSDVRVVTDWLTSQGFRVNQVAKGRTVIDFSGDAGLVRSAFHTEIHRFVVHGEEHVANASDPQIPSALATVVEGVASLHNFFKKPQLVRAANMISVPYRPKSVVPSVTFPNGLHALGPADFATIYNINPLYTAGITGAGKTIAVVGRSEFVLQDVVDFENVFSLPVGGFSVVNNGPAPGNLGGGEEIEALLDVEWSGAVGRGATIAFVVSQSTETDDGVDLSVLYTVDNEAGDIMTESFGACEANATAASVTAENNIAEQAAAEGITYLAASGDSGAEGCDDPGVEQVATGPISVSLPASTPFTIAVGGTEFNENGNDAQFWNSTSSSGNGFESAKSYIPEDVWNQSCTAAQCGSQNANIAAGGGGASALFSKPPWQAGVSGIPGDLHRDLPDVSLSAALHDPYLICIQASCEPNAMGEISFLLVGGTSASTPAFAGIMALVDQKMSARQGQANYVLYRLAAKENLSQCNSSKTSGLPASTCVFNDVTVGNNAVPGEAGFGTASAKFQSTTGYDQASGLGSVNATNLVNQWHTITSSFTPTATTLSLSPTTGITHGQPVNVSIQVKPNPGSGTPAGDVSLIATPGILTLSLEDLTLSSGSISALTSLLPGGSYGVTAHYAGDGTFAASDSGIVNVTVAAEASTTKVSVLAVDPITGNATPATTAPFGTLDLVRVDVAGASGQGFPTGSVVLLDNGPGAFVQPFNLNSKGYLEDQTASLLVGVHGFQATYLADQSFLRSSSGAPVLFTVTQASTGTTLTVVPSTVVGSNSVALTALVDTKSLAANPTGTVNFLAGGTPLSGTVTQQNVTDKNGFSALQAMLVTTPAATETVTAQYLGDSNYTASTSSPVKVTVTPGFSLSANPPNQNITSLGQSASSSIKLTGGGGFAGSVILSCSVTPTLANAPTCSLSPASISLSTSTTTGTSTLSMATMAAHSGGFRLQNPPDRPAWIAVGGAIALVCVFLFGMSAPKRRWSTLASLFVLAFLGAIVSCGGGGGSSGSPGTTPGSYTVTVTGTGGGLTETTSVSLNVQ